MSDRPEFPELLPPDAPHVVRVLAPGWRILPGIVLGIALIVATVILAI